MYNEWFKTLPANKKGRDFIIGDLHGHYSLLMQGLKEVNFDKSKDRVFCVGDLVDRGGETDLCLSLLKEDWFFAVIGNHEYMFLDKISKGTGLINKIQSFLYGDKKKKDVDFAKKYQEYESIIKELPVMIRVEDPNAPFYIVHSGRAYNKKKKIWSDKKISKKSSSSINDKKFRKMVWKRKVAKQAMEVYGIKRGEIDLDDQKEINFDVPKFSGNHCFNKKISVTYAGHTIMKKIITYKSHIFIDGGRYKGGVLNIIEHNKVIDRMIEYKKSGGQVPKSCNF